MVFSKYKIVLIFKFSKVIDYIELNYDEDFDFEESSYWEFKNDDLWTPKSLVPCSYTPNKSMSKRKFLSFIQSTFSDSIENQVQSENFELYVQDINISLEIEELDLEDIPVITVKSSLKVQVKDWSDQFQLNGTFVRIKSIFNYFSCYLF